MSDYNGWKNRQTRNVNLWINNDEGLYFAAVEYMRGLAKRQAAKGRPGKGMPYKWFIKSMGMEHDQTPDGIKWISTRLDYKALNEMMWEMVE